MGGGGTPRNGQDGRSAEWQNLAVDGPSAYRDAVAIIRRSKHPRLGIRNAQPVL